MSTTSQDIVVNRLEKLLELVRSGDLASDDYAKINAGLNHLMPSEPTSHKTEKCLLDILKKKVELADSSQRKHFAF